MQALIATSLALLVSTVATVGYVQSQINQLRQAAGKNQGIQLDRLAAAVDNYIIQNFSFLTGGGGSALKSDGTTGTVATPLSPTVAELVTMGYLQGAFSSTNVFGGGYATTLAKVPAGCTYPNCAISGSVSLTNAITRAGVPDALALGAAVQQVGADTGFSTSATPGTISGASNGWNTTNPAGNVAGILAERVGQNAQRYNTFVRRDGALAMTGPLTLTTVTEGGACSGSGVAQNGSGVLLSCQSGTWQRQVAAVVLNSASKASAFYPGAVTVCAGAGGSTCEEYTVGPAPLMTLTLNKRDYLTKVLTGSFVMCNFSGTSGLNSAGNESCRSGSSTFVLTLDGIWKSNGTFWDLTTKAFYPWQ